MPNIYSYFKMKYIKDPKIKIIFKLNIIFYA